MLWLMYYMQTGPAEEYMVAPKRQKDMQFVTIKACEGSVIVLLCLEHQLDLCLVPKTS